MVDDTRRSSSLSRKEADRHLLGAKEAARYLGISLSTLTRIEKRGDLSPYRTPGGHRRYSIEMLEKYLEKSRETCRRGGNRPRNRASGNLRGST